ncbi:MAG: TolC family protein [Methylotetracoccus sp.]
MLLMDDRHAQSTTAKTARTIRHRSNSYGNRPAVLACLLAAIFASPGIHAELALSEERAIGLFYARSLELLSAAYGLDATRAEQIVAAAIPNPELNLYSQEIAPQYPDSSIGPAIYANLQQLIETAGKRRLRMESSELGTRAAENELLDTARTLTQWVRRAFFGLLLAQKNAETARDQLTHVEKLADAYKSRYEAGDIAERDLRRIELEVDKVRSDIDRIDADLTAARARLATMLAWPRGADGLVAEDRWPGSEAFGTLTDAAAASTQAIDRRPDIQAAKLRHDQAKKEVELAKAQAIPNVTILAGFGHDWGNIVTNAATLGLSVPLPLFYRNEGQIANAAARANDREVQVRKTENTVRSEVYTAIASWRSANSVVLRFENDVLKKAKYIRDSAEFAYAQGGTDIVDLIQAERDYRNAMLDYFQAEASRAFAYADLKTALGEDNPSIESVPETQP